MKKPEVTIDSFFRSCNNIKIRFDDCMESEELSLFDDTEQKICNAIKTAETMLSRYKYRKVDETIKSQIKCSMEICLQLLLELRKKYIVVFNKTFNCEFDADEVLGNLTKKPKNISMKTVMFKKFMRKLIPEHPKDEYKKARQIQRKFIIHAGETNTGKTYQALKALKTAESGIYLAPLRLLALQIFQELNDDGVPCSLLTGEEESIIPEAGHVSSTIEKLDTTKKYDVVVIDEAQMISDMQRGNAWTRAILGAFADEVHICCSPNAVDLLVNLIQDCKDTYTIFLYERDTPLKIDRSRFSFPSSVNKGDALIAFSKKMVLSIASLLDEKGTKVSIIYGSLPPNTRKKQIQMFMDGETDVVVATDAIGMGLNLPIKRVVFMEIGKYDGLSRRTLEDNEIKQIAGRAGRKNVYNVGYVNAIDNKKIIKEALEEELTNISRAYYLPSREFVLGIPIGSLNERLSACLESCKGNFVRSDISQAMMLYNLLYDKKEAKRNFSLEEQYKLVFIPFDAYDNTLLYQWRGYVNAYAAYQKITYPTIAPTEDIHRLESYYKALDLYYAFCKTMDIAFNNAEVQRLKDAVSSKIHTCLITNMKQMGNKCKKCGVKLEWNFPYSFCESCHIRNMLYEDDYF